ncbi:tryptophan synthase subunit alpha [Selenomonas sp. TAMA-11512]|uniref:tryptophan synthase subunit alpha n=1 Tax=Selenomonas sp. TAMA-11512 TaxID=3095337 RepID=UPI003086A41E|nr:tryptophan synthase subunit alpha [Selenomonas sp. TAMA-11512]
MGTRLEKVLQRRRDAGRKSIFIYITAGCPDVETSLDAIRLAEENGADVIELGLPFSDPMADGPVIQEASVKALQAGMNLDRAKALVKRVRETSEIPILGMGYINNMLYYGFEAFVEDFKAAGMDGVIIPDLPHEESGDMREICRAHDFHLAEFVTPLTTAARMKETCRDASGFIYCVSNTGVTGVKEVDYSAISSVVTEARKHTSVPLAVGFGIGSPEAAVAAAKEADGVIVGSAVVKHILKGDLPAAAALITSMRKALDRTYRDA